MNKIITLKDVVRLYDDEHKKPSFWQIYISNPLSILPTYLIAKFTKLTPNIITLLGFFLFLFSLYLYSINAKLWAVLAFQFSFVFDIVDGNVARLKSESSELGAYLDAMLDWLKPGVLYLFAWYITGHVFLLFLIVVNYMAAAAWRIRDDILEVRRDIKSEEVKNYAFYKKNLSKITSIEAEMIISTFYLLSYNEWFLYLALAIRLKDLIVSVAKSFFMFKV